MVQDSASLPSATGTDTPRVLHLPPGQIQPSGKNPRRKLPGIEELTESIREYGLLQPIVVRPVGGGYEIIAGHRRFAAIQALGWEAVPAVVRTEDPDSAYLLTLVENLQRADLTPKEEAEGLEVLLRERNWGTRQVAEAVKRSPAYVSKRLRVFEDAVLAPLVLTNQLSVSLAEELLPLGPRVKARLAQQAIDEHWDNLRVRAAVRKRFVSKRATASSIAGQVREWRRTLQQTASRDFTEAERRELRRLFEDLALIARAPVGPRKVVLPTLPGMEKTG